MRLVPEIFETIQSGNYLGEDKAYGRISVLPYWQLHSTPSSYGNSIRGPYRYWTDGTTDDEYEVPSTQSISWERSLDQDIGTCTVTIYNAWHDLNSQAPELVGQLGKPGFFWPLRGQSDDAEATWNHSISRGAYKRDGTWDASFSWSNVLIEDVVIKTFEGYGGYPLDSDNDFVSIDTRLSEGKLVQTGVWIVDSVTGGSDGMLTLTCRDIGRLLLDQMVFPPLVPGGVYPLEYYLEGKSPFDSFWGPKVKNGVLPASQGEVNATAYDSSADTFSDTSVTTSHPLSASVDGNENTYALSDAWEEPDDSDYVWFEYTIGQDINSISFTPWAGGYECFICVRESNTWQGANPVVSGGGVNYIKKINIPMYAPDGSEQPITIQLKDVDDQTSSAAHYTAQRVRLGFKHLYYSGIPDASGNHYRAGIREFHAYRSGDNVSPYSSDFSALPWTFAMDEHPTRGYWVMDDSGNVYGFGDAADYDTDAFGQVPIGSYSNNIGVALAAHPDGKGYWALDWRGRVWAYGSATDYGEAVISDPYVGSLNQEPKTQAIDIVSTYTGNGYWVVYTNGIVRGFGDATNYTTGSYTQIPTTQVASFMDVYLRNNYQTGRYLPYLTRLKSVAIGSHPKKIGFWVTDGSGQVWSYGACSHRGQLHHRVYNKGMSNSFRLEPLDWASALEPTVTGNGYWILFASGKIAAFGDAVNQGPVDVYEHLRGFEQNVAVDPQYFDYTGFRYLTWGFARDPDGSGFWILTAAGDVLHYDAEFWGQPGYQGATGYRWHEGNWDGDYISIAKELLMWAGFLNYDASIAPTEDPTVLGGIESTGIKSDAEITGDKFDKKTIIDAIRELIEVVGYIFYIDPEGGARLTTPNWWGAGNFDLNGERIYVEEDTFTEADSGDPGVEVFIPLVHEAVDMLSYSATLSSADKRSELIIGTDTPDPKNPKATKFIRYTPPAALDQVKPGVPSLRNIVRQGIWTSQIFELQEERKLMAELIGLHAWFAQRTGSVSCVGNPCISVDDQVRLVERNTSETYIHRIQSISSNLDNDSGVYTMDLGTHWMGTADNWVITTETGHGDAYGDSPYVSISERVDSWQSLTNRGLTVGGHGSIDDPFEADGEFDSSIASIGSNPAWGVDSEDYLETGFGDDNQFVNFMMFGNGVEWPYYDHATAQDYEDGGTTFLNSYLSIYEAGKDPILTFGLAPEVFQDAGDAGPDTSDPSEYIDRLIDILTEYPISRVIVWKDFEEIGYDINRYVDFFDDVYTAVKGLNEGIKVYGPNVNLAARSGGFDTSYNGVTVDSRDMDLLTGFIANAAAYDGVAISGGFSDSDWGDLIDYLKDTEGIDDELLVSLRSATTGAPTALNAALDEVDIALWPSSVVYEQPFDPDFNSWGFEGTLNLKSRVSDVYVSPESLSAPLGESFNLEIYNGASLIFNRVIYEYEDDILIGDLGVDGSETEYSFIASGTPVRTGTGEIELRFHASSVGSEIVKDQIVILKEQ